MSPATTSTEGPAPTTEEGPGGIAVRPEIEPAILAVLAAAVDQTWPRLRIAVPEQVQKPPAWRFSGRWWSRPATTRRDRPWAGG